MVCRSKKIFLMDADLDLSTIFYFVNIIKSKKNIQKIKEINRQLDYIDLNEKSDKMEKEEEVFDDDIKTLII